MPLYTLYVNFCLFFPVFGDVNVGSSHINCNTLQVNEVDAFNIFHNIWMSIYFLYYISLVNIVKVMTPFLIKISDGY